jgi:hypothetical protein
MVIDVTDKDMELDGFIDKEVLVKVKDNLGAAYKKQKILKKRYLNMIQDNTDPETVFGKVLKQLVTIKLQDLLACSFAFTKLLFKGVLVQTKAKVLTTNVGSIRSRQRTKKAYATKTPKLLVKVDRALTQAMLDTRAKVNVITKAAADKLGLLVCTDLLLALKAVSGDTRVFDRACEDVEIDIKEVVNH